MSLAATVALAWLASACAVAEIDRYMLRSATAPVRLEGAGGVLTRAQSQSILEGLKKRSPETSIFDRHVAVEEAIAGNALSVGNRVQLLEDGARTYASMLAAIKAARHSVHMETYIFEADEVGNRFAAALAERARAGVKVKVLYDSVGSAKTPKEFFNDLAAKGVEVEEFNPVTPAAVMKGALQHRDHRKLTVVDGRVAFLGGINISSVYVTGGSSLGGATARRGSMGSGAGSGTGSAGAKDDDPPFEKRPWRDTQVRVEGPVVADLQRAFLKQWARQKKEEYREDKQYFPPLGTQGPLIVRAIAASPGETNELNALYITLISAIENAETEIRITNAYFVPHKELLKSLQEAARRGVDVKLILPSRTDSWLVHNAGRSFYEDLLEAGVKIYERKTRLLHAKTATVDGVWSTVGSTNLDWRSLVYNDELNAVVLGPEFAAQVNAMFDKDLADPQEITRESWSRRPLQDRVKELTARAWGRLL